MQVENVGVTGKTRIQGVIKKKIGNGISQNMALLLIIGVVVFVQLIQNVSYLRTSL